MDSLAAFIATAVFGGLVFRLIYERLDDFSVWLVRMQCKLLLEPDRLETEAELTAVIYEVKGNTWKLLNALGFARIVLPKASFHTPTRSKEASVTKNQVSPKVSFATRFRQEQELLRKYGARDFSKRLYQSLQASLNRR